MTQWLRISSVVCALALPSKAQILWTNVGFSVEEGFGASLATQNFVRCGELDCDLVNSCPDFAAGGAAPLDYSLMQQTSPLAGVGGAVTNNSPCFAPNPFITVVQFPLAGFSTEVVCDPNFSPLGAVVGGNPAGNFIMINGKVPPSLSAVLAQLPPGLSRFGHTMEAADLNGDLMDELYVSDPDFAGGKGLVLGFQLVATGIVSDPIDIQSVWSRMGAAPGDRFGYALRRTIYASTGSQTLCISSPGAGLVEELDFAGNILRTFQGSPPHFGVSIADVGDLDGDAIPEIAVGAAAMTTDFPPIQPALLPVPSPTAAVPGTVTAFFSATTTTLNVVPPPLALFESSFGWALCADPEHAGGITLIITAPSTDLLNPNDGIAYAYEYDQQLQTFVWMGSYIGQVAGEGFGYAVDCVDLNVDGGEGGGALCTPIVFGAPFSDDPGVSNRGRVYGYNQPIQLSYSTDCATTSNGINPCWVDSSSGTACPLPALTKSGTANATSGGILTFSVSFNSNCLPAIATSPALVLSGSLTNAPPPPFQTAFCLKHPASGCAAFIPIVADALTQFMMENFTVFMSPLNVSSPTATGTVSFTVPANTNALNGVTIHFAGAILSKSAPAALPFIVGTDSVPHTF